MLAAELACVALVPLISEILSVHKISSLISQSVPDFYTANWQAETSNFAVQT